MNQQRTWWLVFSIIGSLLVTGSALIFWLWILPTQAAPQSDPPCVSGPHSGNITSDQRWCSGANHTITNDVIVAEDVTLIISPGVTVGFNYSYPGSRDLIIHGTLIARGTPTDTIFFTSNANIPSKGDWGWIYFGPYSVNNVLDYTIIQWAGGFPGGLPSVKTETNSLTIDHSIIRRGDGHGLEISNVSPTIRNTIFDSNDKAAINQSGGNCFPVLEGLQAINNGENAILVGGATISQNYIWGDAGIPNYAITSDVTIQTGVTLTVTPGSKLLFDDYQDDLIVLGTLKASGTSTQTIRISSRSATPASGNWGQINFGVDSLDNVLDYVTVEYGNGMASSSILNIQTSSLLIDHATIRRNGDNSGLDKGAILISNASPIIRNAVIQDNDGSAIYFNSGLVFPQMSNLSASGNTYDAITFNTANISTDYTWGGWGIDILRLLKSVTIDQGVALTITPGTTVKMADYNTNLITSGRLAAEGTPSQPILFTSTSNTPSKGAWGRLFFEATSSGNKLAYVTVEYGGGILANESIYVNTSSLDLQHTIVVNSGKDGIRVNAATPFIWYNQIYDNNGKGVNNVTTTQTVTARCNWWGSPSGPTHTSNPSGTGEDVSDRVIFSPWLLGPEEECNFFQIFLPFTSR